MAFFILELGTEEMPARFLPLLDKELAEKFTVAFEKEGVVYSALRTRSTPRRMVVSAMVEEKSQQREELVMGPPKKVAYDVGGRPTKAAEGFARTNGVGVDELFIENTDKGEYLAVRKQVGGEDSLSILSRHCPDIVTSLSFPKRMHWGSGTFTFGRPLRWIVALLDETVVPFCVGGVVSGRETKGHRVHGFGPFPIAKAQEYEETIAGRCSVVLDGARRRAVIREKGDKLATEAGGTILWKEELLDEVQGLCELPVPLLGSFEEDFLEIPREVLLTSMEGNQKSFGLEDASGRLLPRFLTVLNIIPHDVEIVRKGWERVLRARLEDARFFWKSDLAVDMEEWVKSLDAVIFLAPLGSMGDKTRRIEALASWLATETRRAVPEDAARAGHLAKADLVSGMVGEFDTLQGIMGGIYARKRGEKESVYTAIAEQYLPTGPSSPVPATAAGALLSMADKADTLAGCFGLGMIPTGAVDPYALRRCALGIARIIAEHEFELDMEALFQKAFSLYGERNWKLTPDIAMGKLMEFFATRLKNLLISQGSATLLVDAALGAGSHDVRSVYARLAALQAFSESEGFLPAVQTFKRVANIVRKQEQEGGEALAAAFDVSLLQDESEKQLAEAITRMTPRFEELWNVGKYSEILGLLLEIRPAVEAFFDGVMVMAEEERIRRNRLGMLKSLAERFSRLADFTALQI